MKHIITTVSSLLQKVEASILSAAILGIAVLTIANVVTRTLFGTSIALAEEVSQFLIIVVTFVGLSYAASLGRHIRMTALSDQLSSRGRMRLANFVQATTALLMFVLCGYACTYVHAVYRLGGVYPVTRIPYYVVYLVVPLGFLLAGCQFALSAIKGLTGQIDEQPVAPPNPLEQKAGV